MATKISKVLSDFAHWEGAKTLEWIDPKIFFCGISPRPNPLFQICWRSVQGFSVGWGSHLAIPHWLWRSSLQHSYTTVWACDIVVPLAPSRGYSWVGYWIINV